MEFNKEQKKALKLAVEETGYGYFQDMEIAKDNLDGLSVDIKLSSLLRASSGPNVSALLPMAAN